jgi:ribonuclease PH
VRFIADTPASTASKLSTVSLKINTSAVTGGAVALTTAGVDTKGKVVNGSAVTAANTFDDNDTIKAVAASTTAFVEGSGYLEVLVVVS